MKTIIDERGAGKAKRLLEAAKNDPRGVVLTQDKRALQVKAKNYGITNLTIIDWEDIENDRFPIDAVLYIHNGDKVLEALIKKYYFAEVGGFTATVEEKNEQRNNNRRNNDNGSTKKRSRETSKTSK